MTLQEFKDNFYCKLDYSNNGITLTVKSTAHRRSDNYPVVGHKQIIQYVKRIYSIILLINLCGLAYSQTSQSYNVVNCKEFNIPFTDTIAQEFRKKSSELDFRTWNQFGLDSVEKFNENFSYYVTCKLSYNHLDLFIIERRFREESIHWTCIIGKTGKLIDFEITAYDNSEGFFSKYSTIFENRIEINEYNEFASTKTNKRTIYLTKEGFEKEMPVPNNK